MSRSHLWVLLCIAVLALLPLLSLWGHPDSFLGHPESELPVKIWGHVTFSENGIFGGVVDQVSFPHPGPLNNPDPLGSLFFLFLRPLFGISGAYNSLIVLQLALTMGSTWLLARDWLRDDRAAFTSAVAFAFAPLLISYGIASSIIDILHVWPYPLAIWAAVRACRSGHRSEGIAAGVLGGLGFVTCPYNAVVFVVGLSPLALWAFFEHRKGQFRISAGMLAILGGSALLIAGPYALWMRSLMVADASQMSEVMVASTRHYWPYPYLMPGNDRFYSTLSDYFLLGKNSLILRSAGSRFFRSVGPGYAVFCLTFLALGLRHRRGPELRPWLGVTLVSVLASTGPYLLLTNDIGLPFPGNPFWLLPHWLVPGAAQILEPFRYGLPAALGFAMLAGVGTTACMDHLGRWFGLLAPGLLLLGLGTVEPVPTPLPVAEYGQEPTLREIIRNLPPGGIIRLPYYDEGTSRFCRRHFYEQLKHGRPIPDQAAGFPSSYMIENRFLLALLLAERADGFKPLYSHFSTPPTAGTPSERALARAQLVADGFVAIIVDPENYANEPAREEARALLREIGEAQEVGRFQYWRLK